MAVNKVKKLKKLKIDNFFLETGRNPTFLKFATQPSAKGAYLTTYLSLTLAVLLSLCFTLIEGARRNAVRLEAECVTDIGLNSIFAEYNRALFGRYNILAIDSSYCTDLATVNNVKRHLQDYIERNTSMKGIAFSDFIYRDFLAMYPEKTEIADLMYLTDENGRAFRKACIDAMEDDYGLDYLEQLKSWMTKIESEGYESYDAYSEKEELDDEIEEMVEEAQSEKTETVTNPDGTTSEVEIDYEEYESPTQFIDEMHDSGIMALLFGNGEELSNRRIEQDSLIKSRMQRGEVNKGSIPVEYEKTMEESLEKLLFIEYLGRYMAYYGAALESVNALPEYTEQAALSYQLEEIVAGKGGDYENLKSVAERLLFLRTAANTIYILGDAEKREVAQILATAIAFLVACPEMADLLTTSILIGWAFAESVYDVRSLFKGSRVPLMKDDSTWHYGLEGALQFGKDGAEDFEDGMCYEDYLKVFMLMLNKEEMTLRAMNLVEADMRIFAQNTHFRLDGCITELEATVTIGSAYGYSFEGKRRRKYSQ